MKPLSLDERQRLEDMRVIMRLVVHTLDPNARLDLEDRSTLAWLLRQAFRDELA